MPLLNVCVGASSGYGRICGVYNSATSTYSQYIYDAEGRRVSKGTISNWSYGCDVSSNGFARTKIYLLSLGGGQVSEYSVSGSTVTWVHTNVMSTGKVAATYDSAGTHFEFSDWRNTKRVQASTAGAIESTWLQMPFGDQLYQATGTSDATEHHFIGKEHDSESGLDDFGARYYNSFLARWMSPDWSAIPQAIPYASIDDPRTLNLYAYAGSNPVSAEDDDGHAYRGVYQPGFQGGNGDELAAEMKGWDSTEPPAIAKYEKEQKEKEKKQKEAQQQATLNIQVIRSDNLTGVGQSAANAQISDLKKDMAKLGIAINITSDSTLSSDAINHLKSSSLNKGSFVYVFGTDAEVAYTSSSGWFSGRVPGAMINEAAQGSEGGVATHEMLHYLRGDNNTTNPRAWYRENSVEWARKRLDWGWTWGLGYLRDSAAHPPQ